MAAKLSVRSRRTCVTFAASLFVMLLLTVTASPTWAKNLYVDVAGVHGSCSDSVTYANNNQTHPWCSIQKAADNVNAGDTVIVANGTYTDKNGDGFIVNISRSGTAANLITFKAENKWGAVLDGQNDANDGILFSSSASYINIEDFEIKNVMAQGMAEAYNTSPSHLYIYRNKIHDVSRVRIACGDSYGRDGIEMAPVSGTPSYITIDSNIIYNIGRLSGGCSSPAWQDYVHDHGIYIGGNNNTIVNNVFYNCLSGYAITDGYTSETGWTIVNNTFYGTNPYPGIGHIYLLSPINDFVIQNNISYTANNNFVQVMGSYSNLYLYNNLVNGTTLVNSGIKYTQSGNITGQDPKFVNPTTFDFHLQAGSPAIDKGKYYIGYDADDNTRVGNPDIGAYEYESAGPNTPTPSPTPAPAPAPTPTPIAVDGTPPSAPAGLTATAVSSSQINLAWTPSTDNVGVAGYKVYRNGVQIATTTATSYVDKGLLSSTSYTYGVRAYDSAGNNSSTSSVVSSTSSSTSNTYISDLPWVGTPTNGWGPAEKDMSNGENSAGDGHTITLNGVTYAKGLGVHAASQVTYNLAGNYSRFVSDIGVDDEVGNNGSVVFQVWADGVKIYDSGIMTGSSATKNVNVDVTGVDQLQLVVTNGGDNIDYDHADWAGAYLTVSN